MNIKIHNLCYLIWGVGSSFAFTQENVGLIQALAFIPILLFWFFVKVGVFIDLFNESSGRLILMSALVACFSGFLNGFTAPGLIHYLALIPVFAVLTETCHKEEYFIGAVKSLALASFIFVVYHVLFTDFKEVMNPYYRLSVFINTNSVGFIAAICVVVHLMFFFNRRHFNFSLPLIVEALAIILGMFVVYITRSRTATIALIGGILSVFVFTSRIRYKRLLLVPTIIIITLLSSLVFGQKLFSIISSNYSFNDQYRDISHMTNRTDIWEYTVNTIIYPHPFLGFGPGKAEELIVNSAIGISIDNGFLKCLAEIGIIGIIPLILLLYHPLRIVIKDLTKAKLLFPILIAGIIESFAENMLFSTGNVGSLLFLLSIISGNE